MENDDLKTSEDKKKQRLIDINKYGSIFLNDQFFNHNEEIGENYLYYKPEEITIYIGKKMMMMYYLEQKYYIEIY